MQTVVIVNLFSIFPLLFTIYLAKRHLSGSRQNWYYIFASIITIILLAVEIVGALISGKPGNAALAVHYLSYALGYAITPLVPMIILFYLGCSEWPFTKKLFLFIPLACNVVNSILSIQSGLYFTILATNVYQRGRYFWLVTAFSAYYYLWILIRLLHINKSRVVPSKILMGSVYTLPILSTAFQMATRDEIFVFSTVAIALLLYYLIVQEAQFDYDGQTKVYNREAFEQELLARQYHEQDSAIFMFDVNNLKQTNDVWGHQEGDSLLASVAQILTSVFEPDGKVFRIGGDEFAVLLPLSKKADPAARQEQLLQSVASANESRVHPISIAYGFAISNKEVGISLRKAFNLADEAMYRNKSEQRRMLRQQT
ncbi:MAG: GGDEF domain-containing protein [Spirochaetales bacterium]|jgi:diguanylate cyclase (GGDEF)-like protein|nr:GGDEF domain-containing protein [Spirochaetales bacterium]